MIKKYDHIEIPPQFHDPGNGTFQRAVVEDEGRGAVETSPIGRYSKFKPWNSVETRQIKLSSKTVCNDVNPEDLAVEFSIALRKLLSPNDMNTVTSRNAAEADHRICHSHDFCDANIVMHEVFMSHGMDPAVEDGVDRWGSLWEAAWNIAKMNAFRTTTAGR